MAMYTPQEIDSYFFLDVITIFLMINYNMPLATIYFAMVLLCSLMYYVAADQRLFQWIPFSKSPKVISTLVGIGMGVGFFYIYNYIGSVTPMANVFATTAFGESEQIGKLIFGFLIPIAETRFFFRTILQWYAWKTNTSTRSLFSFDAIQLMAIFSAIFTIFHATAKGIDNNLDLIATFTFGVISIGAILYFQELFQAVVAHITINGYSIGLFDAVIKYATTYYVYIIGAGVIGYFIYKNKGGIPFVS